MGLYNVIQDDMKRSLKEGDALKLSVLRMLVSDIKMVEIKKNIKEAVEEDVVGILQRHIKQHKDSIDQFNKGGRKDLADKESKELKILEIYLPKQLGEGELLAVVRETIDQMGATSKSETGKVMKAVMEKVKGKADGKAINQLVMSILK